MAWSVFNFSYELLSELIVTDQDGYLWTRLHQFGKGGASKTQIKVGTEKKRPSLEKRSFDNLLPSWPSDISVACLSRTLNRSLRVCSVHAHSRCLRIHFTAEFAPFFHSRKVKVARNEVKNSSFAQRSAHRDSRIWRPELIEPAAERKRRARRRRRTFKSAYSDPQVFPQCNISSNYPL